MTEPKKGQGVTLQPGSRLGPYEVMSLLGAGGMGEVYRARDTRLAREVALKILPNCSGEDTGRFRRFQTEAKAAAALTHPNIVAVYDVGQEAGTPYIVSELVSGKTLTTLLERGPIPVTRLLDLAVSVAEGLAAAHAIGIVHRDLKPDNVLLSADGKPKIADFGLAKYFAPVPSEGTAGTTLPDDRTREGTIVGTVGYMSPEQAEGKAVDYRSDQFSFGSLLYEMATGRRAFQGKSVIDTLAAIINEEPEPIRKANPRVPAPLAWIIERCHAKEPNRRYASTEDLARELATLREHLSDAAAGGAPADVAPRRLHFLRALTAGVAVAALALVYFIGVHRGIGKVPKPTFHQLTYQRGSIRSARLTSDGRTVVYSASTNGASENLFSARIENQASASLVLSDVSLAAVSSSAELLLFPPRHFWEVGPVPHALSRAPLAGGAPRVVAEGVLDADWGPDGKAVALVRRVGEHARLEYPIGKVLVQDTNQLISPRVSRDGRWVAYYLSPGGNSSVAIVDRAGHVKILSSGWVWSGSVLEWSPKGDEIWFTATKGRGEASLRAVSLSGREREVLSWPGFNNLQDVSSDGRVLLTHGKFRQSIRCRRPGWEGERDLSWFMSSGVRGISADGRAILFEELGDASAPHSSAYLRGTDGSPAQRVGEGFPVSLSPDGLRVLAWEFGQRQYLVLSTGAGEPRRLLEPEADSDFEFVTEGSWFPDSRRVVLVMRKKGGDLRTYSLDVETGKLEPLTPANYHCRQLSPDGKKAFCDTPQGRRIYSFDSHETREVSGLGAEDGVLEWSSDGDAFFVQDFKVVSKGARPQIFRLDLASGQKQLWRESDPLAPAGLEYGGVAITPDGGSYCYTAIDSSNDLYLVEGLK